jgi:hypothetical protein
MKDFSGEKGSVAGGDRQGPTLESCLPIDLKRSTTLASNVSAASIFVGVAIALLAVSGDSTLRKAKPIKPKATSLQIWQSVVASWHLIRMGACSPLEDAKVK